MNPRPNAPPRRSDCRSPSQRRPSHTSAAARAERHGQSLPDDRPDVVLPGGCHVMYVVVAAAAAAPAMAAVSGCRNSKENNTVQRNTCNANNSETNTGLEPSGLAVATAIQPSAGLQTPPVAARRLE